MQRHSSGHSWCVNGKVPPPACKAASLLLREAGGRPHTAPRFGLQVRGWERGVDAGRLVSGGRGLGCRVCKGAVQLEGVGCLEGAGRGCAT